MQRVKHSSRRSTCVQHTRFGSIPTVIAFLAFLTLPSPSLNSQSGSQPNAPLQKHEGQSVHDYVNELAQLSNDGNVDATRELTRQTFRVGGMDPRFPDEVGLTEPIVQAETAYRHGRHGFLHDSDIVRAFNEMADKVKAPVWVHTDQSEIQMLRERLVRTYPKVFVDQGAPDAGGRKTLSEKIGPLEAVFIAVSLTYQKHYNADFQFTEPEKSENKKLDTTALNAEHLRRVKAFGNLANGLSPKDAERDMKAIAAQMLDSDG